MIETKFKCPVCGEPHLVTSELKVFEEYTLENNYGRYYFWVEDSIKCGCGVSLELYTEDNASFGKINIRVIKESNES